MIRRDLIQAQVELHFGRIDKKQFLKVSGRHYYPYQHVCQVMMLGKTARTYMHAMIMTNLPFFHDLTSK